MLNNESTTSDLSRLTNLFLFLQLKCKFDTNKIVLHSKNLRISEKDVRVLLHNDEFGDFETMPGELDEKLEECKGKCDTRPKVPMRVMEHGYHEDYELYIITLANKMNAGMTYSVYIPYEGEITQGLAGLYRSKYKDKLSGRTQ